MRNLLLVTFDLANLTCHDEADGIGNAEPYLWTVFFMIDGTTCRLNDSLKLEGTATVFSKPGSHGDLGNSDVDAGDSIAIPPAIGLQTMTLVPIPAPASVQMVVQDLPAIAGCLVVLMEEDNVSDSGAEAGHQALNAAVKKALDDLIPTLGVSHQSITDGEIASLMDQIEKQVREAVVEKQTLLQNAWSWLNADDVIGTALWKFSGDHLLANDPQGLHQRWTNDNGDWELSGAINTAEIHPCPADVVREFHEDVYGPAESEKSVKAMHNFRKGKMNHFASLAHWWGIALNNSHFLRNALEEEEIAGSATKLFNDVDDVLANPDKPVSDEHFNHLMKVLHHISTINTSDFRSINEINRVIQVLHPLRGKTPHEMMEVLGKTHPGV